MRAVTTRVMREIDRRAVEEYGIPSLILMENAGMACAREVGKLIPAGRGRISVFAGRGNNGGDGFVAARHLSNRGFQVGVFFFQDPSEMKPDPLAHFRILEKMGLRLWDCGRGFDEVNVRRVLRRSDAVVDALFGTGLSKTIEEPFKTVIEWINASGLPVLSVDIPSGLNADTGEVMGIAVRAARTVVFGLPKKGFYLKAAKRYTGKIVVADISLPSQLLKSAVR